METTMDLYEAILTSICVGQCHVPQLLQFCEVSCFSVLALIGCHSDGLISAGHTFHRQLHIYNRQTSKYVHCVST